jgi:hypothetical protein
VGRVLPIAPAACGGSGTFSLEGRTVFGLGDSYDAASMLCATGFAPDGAVVDSCYGDSGGPLWASLGGEDVLFGITSWGLACGTNSPGVYARVDTLRPIPRPTVPSRPQVGAVPADRALELSVAAPFRTGGTAVRRYAVEVSTGRSVVARAVCRPSSLQSPFTACRVDGLRPGVRYTATVRAVNATGSSPSATDRATTLGPPAAPAITRTRFRGNTLEVRTTTPAPHGAQVTSVVVTCVHPVLRAREGSARGTTIRVPGLVAGERYRCTAAALNRYGTSPSSRPVTVRR